MLSVTAHNSLTQETVFNFISTFLVENKRICTHFSLQKRQLKWDIVELTEIIHFQTRTGDVMVKGSSFKTDRRTWHFLQCIVELQLLDVHMG